ncbi:deoxyribodipyrimidine photo-lyase [Pikeienuella piscinae]|uniref:Deoxyribodipyrimidine photo-lyase n=1 Tax=Pikeienuella piscinae TaxID=2748098 RepID=A0A7L5BWZ3_9RHOB|nr:deoxyribodipyrimidine photo-lyase [Pikeienuella piscinae]QIE55971.1 deoxyribodipyrimidine photo-lyase [Pikeienuella piscinae]
MSAITSIVWFRRDLRLSDHEALLAAAAEGPVLPLFILDPVTDAALSGAQRLRLKASLIVLAADLKAAGSRLILRRGEALATLLTLIAESGARAVRWTRLTDGPSIARDTRVKAALKAQGVTAESHGGLTLLDPWRLKTGAGAPYRVFTPFLRALTQETVAAPLPRVRLAAPEGGIASEDIERWRLDAPMGPAAPALADRFRPGEAAARDRLDEWLDGPAARYPEDRDRLDRPEAGTGLSDHLALGEISPRTIWAALDRAGGAAGPEAVRRQLVWRDFAHSLLFHDPEMERENWRREWAAFPWRGENDDAERWRRGETGVDVIDAAMRELWATGRMHNRARMLVASYLTKHLLTHWRIGAEWFRETLIDWDPANNAMGWQWVAGSGPDAAPFFRIFNPETQAGRFDPDGAYRDHWLTGAGAETFRAMSPKDWRKAAHDERPAPMIGLKAGRERALEAWARMREKTGAVSAEG